MVKDKGYNQDSGPKATRFPRFIKMILQSTIEDKKMIIPPKFVMKFGDTLSDSAELALFSGCTWPVGLTKESRSIYFDKNWHEFVEHHSIRQGYMLFFSYSKRAKVSIENNAAIYADSKRAKVSIENNAAIEAANMFKPEKPSFTVVLKPYNLNKYMYIGTEFASIHLRGVSDSIWIVNPEGRKWLIKLLERPNNSLMLLAGWNAFIRDNSLQVGDVCVFELIERKKNALKVTIFRQSPNFGIVESNPKTKMEKHGLSKGRSLAIVESGSSNFDENLVSNYEKHPPKFSNGEINARYPSFTCLLRSYNSRVLVVRVLNAFAKKYMRRECDEIKVKDPVGREWKVKLGWPANSKHGPYLSNGWTRLAEANGFKVGDVCVFEYVNANEPILKVSIFE